MAGGGWSDLPLDLFSLIFSKLSFPQFLRSAAVCASWSSAVGDLSARSRCVKFRGQSPWLVLNNDDNPSGVVTFFALDEAREYTIPVPDPPITDRIFLGSAHGWIITMDVRLRVQLLNPITGAQIDLPGFVFLSEHTHPIRDTAGRLIGFRMPSIPVNEEELQIWRGHGNSFNVPYLYLCLEQHHLKAILSADPSLGDGYTVALIQYPYGPIFFTRSGDEKWLQLRCPVTIDNMIFHKGKLYLSTITVVYFCDLDEARIRIRHGEMPRFRVVDRSRHLAMARYGEVDRHLNELHYMFETPRGDLFSIWRERNENHTKTIYVKVYRMMIEEEKRGGKRIDMLDLISSGGRSEFMAVMDKQLSMLREEAKDLGDLTVFLGGRHPLCLSPCDFPAGHLTPNSIYFMDGYYDIQGDTELVAYYRPMFKERAAPIRSAYHLLQLMFSERNWLRKFLNCRIDNNTFVRLYWQPPSTSSINL